MLVFVVGGGLLFVCRCVRLLLCCSLFDLILLYRSLASCDGRCVAVIVACCLRLFVVRCGSLFAVVVRRRLMRLSVDVAVC